MSLLLPIWSPRRRVSRSAFDRSTRNKADVAIVNRVVRPMRGGNQELGVKNPRFASDQIIGGNRVHVMNQQLSIDLVTRYAEITCLASEYDVVTSLFPFTRPVESLVQPPGKAEGSRTNFTRHGEVLEPLFEGDELTQVRIRSSPHRRSAHRRQRTLLAHTSC